MREDIHLRPWRRACVLWLGPCYLKALRSRSSPPASSRCPASFLRSSEQRRRKNRYASSAILPPTRGRRVSVESTPRSTTEQLALTLLGRLVAGSRLLRQRSRVVHIPNTTRGPKLIQRRRS